MSVITKLPGKLAKFLNIDGVMDFINARYVGFGLSSGFQELSAREMSLPPDVRTEFKKTTYPESAAKFSFDYEKGNMLPTSETKKTNNRNTNINRKLKQRATRALDESRVNQPKQVASSSKALQISPSSQSGLRGTRKFANSAEAARVAKEKGAMIVNGKAIPVEPSTNADQSSE